MSGDVRAVVDHSQQSRYSDPGRHAHLFDPIAPMIDDVSATSRNVIAHYRAHAADLPESSRGDISSRWVGVMLNTDQQRHRSAPLTVERPLPERLQGCCRDHTLLAVAILRHHGVPARSRVGFGRYLAPSYNHDHVIVEAWLDGRWRRFDPEFDRPLPRLPDHRDIPVGADSPFLTAATVWRGHRAGTLDVDRFGVAEGLGIGGDWFVHGYVIAEVAHRFGDELLLWDQWGAMTGDLSTAPPDSVALVDEVADLLVRADGGDVGAETELYHRYRDDPRLHPGDRIGSVSPFGGYAEVDLTAPGSTP